MSGKNSTSSVVGRESSVADVAMKAKVSAATVSRVMNRRADVRPEVRRRVLIASRELGFSRNQSLRSIALIVGSYTHTPSGTSHVESMVNLLTYQLARHRYTVELIGEDEMERAYDASVDGVLGLVFDEQLAKLRNIPNLPIISLNAPMTERGIHSVTIDHFRQGSLATEHLIDFGHQRIGFLERVSENWGSRERLAGYQHALGEAGLEYDPQLVEFVAEQPLYEALSRLLRRGVTGLVNLCGDDCLEVLHILQNILNRRIPEDLSVVSVEQLPVFQYLTPPHTIVHQSRDELARVAVDQLIHLIQEGPAESAEVVDITLPCRLIERESVARPPA